MGRIQRLSTTVANQIAAGEVVERPASVVKELVENALDAGATRVEIEVAGGGVDLVRVRDDGMGMAPEDAVLCFERHATSKLCALEDLDSLSTLGFRGEALPSIASVSRVTLTTATPGATEGTRVTVAGGQAPAVESIGAPQGTTVEVRELFFNVPARRKFLKSQKTELGHVSEMAVRIGLSKPDVAIRFISDGRVALEIPKESELDPRGRLGRILGAELAEELFVVADEGSVGQVRVHGFAGSPALSERTARGLYTFVNGRFVRDRTVQHAVQEGYRTLLERGRYPVVVLWIDVPPERVDVNVHPQKVEVRFEDAGEIHRAVSLTLGRSLLRQPWLKDAQQGGAEAVLALARAVEPPSQGRAAPAAARGDLPDWPRLLAAPELRSFAPTPRNGGTSNGVALPDKPFVFGSGRAQNGGTPSLFTPARPEKNAPTKGFSELEPVGQVFATYLVCQGPNRLVLIDQHAAHERIAFERMRRERATGRVEVQPLLVPRTLELDLERSALAEAFSEQLQKDGFELEPFGGRTWLLKAVPAALGRVEVERLVLDVLDELADLGGVEGRLAEASQLTLSRAACHTAVRAGDRLGPEEIKALLVQLDEVDLGAHCPHGRPVVVEWREREVAALFHRT